MKIHRTQNSFNEIIVSLADFAIVVLPSHKLFKSLSFVNCFVFLDKTKAQNSLQTTNF